MYDSNTGEYFPSDFVVQPPAGEQPDWAAHTNSSSEVNACGYSQRNVPDPYQFTDWREWAQRAYPMLEATI